MAVTDSTTINLYKVIVAALNLNPKRHILLTESGNFPTDLYVAKAIAEQRKPTILRQVAGDELIDNLTTEVSVLLLSHVHYQNAAMHDIAEITQLAQRKGIIVVWDLCHSVGMMPLHLSKIKADFAVGCTYKYLNGGPGSPSFIYVNEKHHAHLTSPIQGWMAHSSPFDFAERFISHQDARAFLAGTPAILSMSALNGALTVFDKVDLELIRKQSLAMSDFFIDLMQKTCRPLQCISPHANQKRGAHVAFSFAEAAKLTRALIQRRIICDYRPPNIIRFSFSPLYIHHQDCEAIAYMIKESLCNL